MEGISAHLPPRNSYASCRGLGLQCTWCPRWPNQCQRLGRQYNLINANRNNVHGSNGDLVCSLCHNRWINRGQPRTSRKRILPSDECDYPYATRRRPGNLLFWKGTHRKSLYNRRLGSRTCRLLCLHYSPSFHSRYYLRLHVGCYQSAGRPKDSFLHRTSCLLLSFNSPRSRLCIRLWHGCYGSLDRNGIRYHTIGHFLHSPRPTNRLAEGRRWGANKNSCGVRITNPWLKL